MALRKWPGLGASRHWLAARAPQALCKAGLLAASLSSRAGVGSALSLGLWDFVCDSWGASPPGTHRTLPGMPGGNFGAKGEEEASESGPGSGPQLLS